ncbi:hypothetical protein [Piscinibacter sp. HJYY11]|uniref:hypothetical protein n=1 Tax=Piscinibacter sp. HJYY11 TaxID=2801333 RepID=UPI00191FBE5C|nr:hypothetical protein [Piscinibacter sp. HJYY11]MBL0727034.1 hypothetical protein [Piscinibacter sp. HJYY11]
MNEASDASALPVSAEGHAFPVLVKCLLTAMTIAVFVTGLMAVDKPAIQQAGFASKLLVVAGLATLMIFNYWVIRSRTSVNAKEIRQSWIWNKHVLWADVVQAKMIYVPFLSWLIAPRLVVRGRGGMVTLFHAADDQVLMAFTRYALAPHMREGA